MFSVHPDFSSKTYTRKCLKLKPCKSYCITRAAVCCQTACGAKAVLNGVTDLSTLSVSSDNYQGATLVTKAACCPYLSIGDQFTITDNAGTEVHYQISRVSAGKIVAQNNPTPLDKTGTLSTTDVVVLHGSDGHLCRVSFYQSISAGDALRDALASVTISRGNYNVHSQCQNQTCAQQVGTTVSCDCDCIARCDC